MAAGSTYTPIATTTLGSNQASVTFSSLGAYTDLILVSNAKTTDSANGNDLKGVFNSDTGSNYSQTQMYGTGSSAVSGRNSNIAWAKVGLTSNSSNSQFANSVCHIMNYSNSTTYKTCIARRDLADAYTVATVSLWRNTAAITSITLSAEVGNLATGSSFTIYGILAA